MNNIEELLKEKLIIPEIQRDYVWGNNELVIKRFINNIKNMKDNELDIGFFYSYKIYGDCNALVDGQQRITTLILLSWYAGVDNVELNKFKFKVRENSNNFLEELLKQKSEKIFEIGNVEKFSDKIKNSIWYKRIWDNDPTVKSILNALDIIDIELKNNEKEDIKNKINNNKIKFSCIEAGDRSLETEYILLNSRGVKLTNSEQLKAILTEDIENKDKWEKNWQDILWECKGDEIYNTDKIWDAVLYWVRDIYVIENNIYKNSDKNEINYNFDLIGIEKENREKLLKILDWIIPVLKIINYNLDIQDKCQFKNIEPPIIGIKVIDIKDKIQGKVNGNSKEYSMEIKEEALFYSILYLIKNEYNIESIDSDSIKDKNIQLDNNILDKIRIFRNLIQNSTINASNLHNAVNSLKNFDINKLGELEGLNIEQQEEEALKLEIFEKYEEYKDLIINIENKNLFRGKIKKLFLLFLSIEKEDEELENNYKLKSFYEDKREVLLKSLENNKTKFKNLFDIYKELNSKKKDIWGELLLEKDVYKYKSDKNYICLKDKDDNEEYGFLKLVYLYIINIDKNISDNSIKLEEFLNKNRKENIINKLNIKNSEDFLKITEPKYQLYILYIIGYDNKYCIFTKINNNKNFGVEGKGKRYKYKITKKNKEERLTKSPFENKLVFQSYRHSWVGGQPYVKTEEFIKEFNIQNFLEEYIK